MANTAQGGASRVRFFEIDTDHTTIGSDPVADFQLIEQTSPTRQDNGGYEIQFTQLQDDQDFHDFIDTYAPVTEATGGEEVTLEDGSIVGGSTASSPDLYMESYGPTISSTPETRKLWAGIVKVNSSSGSYTQVNGSYSKPTLTVTSQKTKANLDINTKFISTLACTGVTQTLEANGRGKVFFPQSS